MSVQDSPVRGVVVVTGTDTGVGKTIVTAAVAAAATAHGLRVAVMKPAQTGVGEADGEETDAQVVARLADPAHVCTLAEFPQPLAPATAARVANQPGLALATVVHEVRTLAASHDLVLVEGAGGLLVPMGPADPIMSAAPADPMWTIADFAVATSAPAVVVARAGLGTLNHTALTVEALDRRGVAALVVVGAWPVRPSLVHHTNLADLPGRLCGVVPDGVGGWPSAQFRAAAAHWLGANLHGCWVR